MGEAAVYVLSYFVSVFSIYRAVTDRNPVFSVLYLILSFLSLASLLIFLSADYLGVLLILVYGGAISILIMFVIMMLDLKQLQVESVPRLRLMTFVAFIVSFFSSVYLAWYAWKDCMRWKKPVHKNLMDMFEIKSNIEVIGEVLYNHYAFQFIMIGFLLFVSMIVVISFVIRKQKKARAQILFKQLEAENEKLMFVK